MQKSSHVLAVFLAIVLSTSMLTSATLADVENEPVYEVPGETVESIPAAEEETGEKEESAKAENTYKVEESVAENNDATNPAEMTETVIFEEKHESSEEKSIAVESAVSDEREKMVADGAGEAEINETNFPDKIFREYVRDNYDTNNNGILSDTEVAAVTQINLSGYEIDSLKNIKGIEFFTALKTLIISDCSLTKLNLSNCPALEILDCSNNQLSELNLSNCPELSTLYCENNQLIELDIRSIPILMESLPKALFCDNDHLAGISNSDDGYWIIYGKWEEMAWSIVNYDGKDKDFYLSFDTKTELVFSDMEAVPLDKEHFPDDGFRLNLADIYDLDKNGMLATVEIGRIRSIVARQYYKDPETGMLSTIPFQSLEGIEYFAFLRRLDCTYNSLNSLDLSGCPNLEEVYCSANNFTSLDISGNPYLLKAVREGNKIIPAKDLPTDSYLYYLKSYDDKSSALSDSAVSRYTLNVDKDVDLVLSDTETIPGERDVITGDVDGDGEITGFDASLVLQYEVGLIKEKHLLLSAADVDNDGEVTGFDASLILQYEVGLIETFAGLEV